MCGCFCNGFINFMLKGKNLLDYTDLFSPNGYENNDKVILKFFSITKRVKTKTIYCIVYHMYTRF